MSEILEKDGGKEDWSVFLTILKTGICRKSVKKENIYLM